MSKRNFSSEKWAAYSALAGVCMAIPHSAQSQIVYYDIPDVIIPENETFMADVNDDGMPDLMFVVQNSFSGDWLVARVFGNLGYYGVGDPQNAVVGYSSGGAGFADALGSSYSVGTGAAFVYNSFNVAVLAYVYYGETHGAFADGTIHFLGFRFTDGTGIHHGWMRLSVTTDPIGITLYDLAFEETTDIPVNTGLLPDPLPLHAQFDAFSASAAEGDPDISLSVSISADADCSFQIQRNEILSTAEEGADYTSDIPTPVIFSTGDPLFQTFSISITDDGITEDDEVLVLDISDISGTCTAGMPHRYTLSIADNDAPTDNVVSFISPSLTVSEAAGDVATQLTISNSADCTAEVHVNTALSTATNGIDYSLTDPSILQFFEDDVTELPVTLSILQDLIPEATEEIKLEIQVSGDCIVSPTNGTMTLFIQDDGDLAAAQPDLPSACEIYAATGILTVVLSAQNVLDAQCKIFDTQGAEVMHTDLHGGQTILDVSSLPAGMYIVSVSLNGNTYLKKIIL